MPEPIPLRGTVIGLSLMFLNAISAGISSLPRQDFGFGSNNLNASLGRGCASGGAVVLTKTQIVTDHIPRRRMVFVVLIVGRMARASVCSFLLTASIEERIPLLQYTVTYRNEGHPNSSIHFTPGPPAQMRCVQGRRSIDCARPAS